MGVNPFEEMDDENLLWMTTVMGKTSGSLLGNHVMSVARKCLASLVILKTEV